MNKYLYKVLNYLMRNHLPYQDGYGRDGSVWGLMINPLIIHNDTINENMWVTKK